MSISTGDVTLDSFRTREFNVNPSSAVENLRTQEQPSTLGGISIAKFEKINVELKSVRISRLIHLQTVIISMSTKYDGVLPNVKKSPEFMSAEVPIISVFDSKSSLVIVISFVSFDLAIVSRLQALPTSSSRTFIPSRINS